MCGYNVIEVNASDERSADALQDVLVQAMSHNSNTFSESMALTNKPNCIIFDEIDGMDNNKNAIAMLVEMIRAPLRDSSSTQSKKTVQPLTRPLICICNNLYAPALVSIRKYCEVFVFQNAANAEVRILAKLRSICQAEGVSVNNTLLGHIITKANYDIRSSINYLQFITLNRLGSGASTEVTLKDISLDSMHLLQQIFKQQKADDVMTQFMSFGDPQHLVGGMFENLHMVIDSSLYKGIHLYNWFSDIDVLNQYNSANMHIYECNQFSSLLAGLISSCYPVISGQRLAWPRKDKDAYFKKAQKAGLASSIIAGHMLHNRPSTQQLVMEIGSALMDIISPPVRCLPFVSLSPQEQQAVREVAAVQESYGLHYVQDRTQLPFGAGGWSKDAGSAAGGGGGEQKKRFAPPMESNLVLEPNLSMLITYNITTISTSFAAEPGPFVKNKFSKFSKGSYPSARDAVRVEAVHAHKAVPKEVREVICAEQHRLSVELKVSILLYAMYGVRR